MRRAGWPPALPLLVVRFIDETSITEGLNVSG
jgi:hypothetical protein